MNIPEATSPVWSDVLQGRRGAEFEFIGARMLVVRLRIELGRDAGAANLARCARELRELFAKNESLRSVQNDLQKLASPR